MERKEVTTDGLQTEDLNYEATFLVSDVVALAKAIIENWYQANEYDSDRCRYCTHWQSPWAYNSSNPVDEHYPDCEVIIAQGVLTGYDM